jgi:hypothetical protein
MTVTVKEQQLGELRWIVLHGPSREAFRTLGRHMRAEISDVAGEWPLLSALRRHVARPPGSQRFAAVRQATEEGLPQAWAELAALAEGAGVRVDDLALLNFRGDLGTTGGDLGILGGCSDMAWRRQRSFIAHNEDGPTAYDGRCAMLTLVIDGQQPVTAFSYPGFLPSNAFTVTGDGLVWTIDHLPVGSPAPGAGRHFVARELQRTPGTIGQAIEYLRARPSAGGFAYTFGDRAGRVVSVESAAGRHGWTEVGPDCPPGPLAWHTNHGRYVTGADPTPGGTSVRRGRALDALEVPADEPDAGWFLRILAGAPLPAGVRADPADTDPTATLCTFAADLTAGDAVLLPRRAAAAVTIPLRDLAHGRPDRQRAMALPPAAEPPIPARHS